MNTPIKSLTRLLTILLASQMVACSEQQENQLVGTLERDRIELKSETNEPVHSRHVQDGEQVEAGSLIVVQDDSRIRARLENAMAQRQQAAARLAELRRGPRKEAIAETEARLAAAHALTVNAGHELERVRKIFDQGLSSATSRDQAEAAYQSSAAQENAIRQALEAQRNGTTEEEIQQANAALEAASAQLRLAELDLERSEIHSPVSGQLEKLLYLPGERPAAGATIAVVLSDARVYARVYVPEPLRSRITPGTELSVQIDGEAVSLPGIVRWVSADASFTPYFALTEHDRSRLSYLAEVDLPRSASRLPSGLPVVVNLPADKGQD